jgi:hypothetical protein
MMKAKMMAGGQNQDGCWRWNDEKRLRRWRCYAHETEPKTGEEKPAFLGWHAR